MLLKLFGSPSLEARSGPVSGPAAQRHRLALLALLAGFHPGGATRDKLAGYLWPEREDRRARNLLNQAVHVLRKVLGEEAILSFGDELRLDPGVVPCDVIAFEKALAAGEYERAVALHAGPFLDGFFLRDAPAFERWVEGERRRLRLAHRTALAALAEECADRDDVQAAVVWWRRLAAEDPYNSAATLRLMEALEAAGDRAGAIRQARVHALLLEQEFEAEPDPEVEALAERLRSEPAGRRSPDPEPPEVREATAEGAPDAYETVVDEAPEPVPPGVRARGGRRRRREHNRSLALGLAGLGGLGALLAAFSSRDVLWPSALDPRRVVVAPFENRTGDPFLDPVGGMAADWITQGLSQTTAVDVVGASDVLLALRRVRGAGSGTPAADVVGALAKDTGAGLVVWGRYYLSGDSLLIQAEISDARRSRVLRRIGPVGGAVEAPADLIERLRQRTLGALAPLLDPRLAAHMQASGLPPSFEAWRAYAEGMESFLDGDWGASIEHFQRATALDTTFLLPVLNTAIASYNSGAFAMADSISRELDGSRERLTPYERALLEMVEAWLGDDSVARYEAAKRAAELAPGAMPSVQTGKEANRLGRPREAIRILGEIDPPPLGRESFSYWSALTAAHHLLGEHRQELKEARRIRELYPDDPQFFVLEARALVGSGRLQEVQRLLDRRTALPDAESGLPALMLATGLEMRAHGRGAAARATFQQALARVEKASSDDQLRPRRLKPALLYLTGRHEEARALFAALAEEYPDSIEEQGWYGFMAALTGDHAEADRIDRWMAGRKPRYRTFAPFEWRACLAVATGRKADAVRFLREAFGHGMAYGLHPHTDPCFDPLRDDPPFVELVAPKG